MHTGLCGLPTSSACLVLLFVAFLHAASGIGYPRSDAQNLNSWFTVRLLIQALLPGLSFWCCAGHPMRLTHAQCKGRFWEGASLLTMHGL